MTFNVDGGPAFPSDPFRFETHDPETGKVNGYAEVTQPGMSLLDYFAGQTLVALGTWTPSYGQHTVGHDREHANRARYAYEQAAAMLNERERILAATESHAVSTPVDE